jgi:hypothetical protein
VFNDMYFVYDQLMPYGGDAVATKVGVSQRRRRKRKEFGGNDVWMRLSRCLMQLIFDMYDTRGAQKVLARVSVV